MATVYPIYQSMQYDGTNGAAVMEWLCGSVVLVTDDEDGLRIDLGGSTRLLQPGDWVIASGGGTGTRGYHVNLTNSEYANYWGESGA